LKLLAPQFVFGTCKVFCLNFFLLVSIRFSFKENSVEQMSFLRTLLEFITFDNTECSKVTNIDDDTRYTYNIRQKQIVSVFHKWHSAAFRRDNAPYDHRTKNTNQINIGPSDLLCDVYDHDIRKERATVMTTDMRPVSGVTASYRITIAPLNYFICIVCWADNKLP